MKYSKLGNSDLNVSRICLGCMGFGNPRQGMHSWTLDAEQSREIIRFALEIGINFFDTAAGYQGGTSEQFLGSALKDLTARQDIILATKFFPRPQDKIEAGISGRQHINSLLDQSLHNLQTDYIDLYILHRWDYHTPLEETMETLQDAVQSGKVREIGVSNCFAWQIAKANCIAKMHGWREFVSIQGHYNLLFREEEREMVPYCRVENIALTPYSPLASGRLVKDRGETSKRLSEDSYAKGKYDATAEQDGVIIDRVAALAREKGLSKSQIALGWLLQKVTSPIVGATKIRHVEDAVSAVEATLSPQEIYSLEEPYTPHKLVGVMAENG